MTEAHDLVGKRHVAETEKHWVESYPEGDNMSEALNSEPRTEPAFNFGEAIKRLKDGNSVSRYGWNGPGQYLTLQVPDEGSKMTLPYIYITTVQGDLVPWLASQTDMLATDWYVV